MEPFILDELDREATRGIVLECMYRVRILLVRMQYVHTHPNLDETSDIMRDLSVVLL